MRTVALLDSGSSMQRNDATVNSVGIEPTHQNHGNAGQSVWARTAPGSSAIGYPGTEGAQSGPPPASPVVGPVPPYPAGGHGQRPARNVTNWLIIGLLVVASVLSVAAIVVTEIRTRQGAAPATTTTVQAGAPVYSQDQIAQAKKEICDANWSTGAALTDAHNALLATKDRTSPESMAALANYQTVVMVETEYLKSKTRPEAPEEVRKAVADYTDALLAEIDAETRMLPLAEIDQRGDHTTATNRTLTAACR
ncbi:hypothetical protein [Mycobacteroides abscessus]|uniref:hypothetical protein n=1 Tax=Mycobacteroides abscessus TaxID=36809 RepID=UPI0013F5DB6C|nr:hypothetical protein [Mycobacteroides abscessus]